MQKYNDIDGVSGIDAYEVGPDSITVQFVTGGTYLYNSLRPGTEHVAEMKRLAQLGKGLNAYINKFVRTSYAENIS